MCFCLNFNLRYSKSQTSPNGDERDSGVHPNVFYIHGNQNVQTIINPNIGSSTSTDQEYNSGSASSTSYSYDYAHYRFYDKSSPFMAKAVKRPSALHYADTAVQTESNFATRRPISNGPSSSAYEPVDPYDNNTKLLPFDTHGASNLNNVIASGPPCKGQGALSHTSSPISSGSMIGCDKSNKVLHQYANITQGRNGESEELPLQDQKVCSHGNSLSGEYVPMTTGYDNNRKLSHSYANITSGGTSNNPDDNNGAAPDGTTSQEARHKIQEEVSNESAKVEGNVKAKHQISFKMYDYPDTSE